MPLQRSKGGLDMHSSSLFTTLSGAWAAVYRSVTVSIDGVDYASRNGARRPVESRALRK